MAFGNLKTVVKLDTPGTTFIVGENLDEGGSSGAGKTTLISAFSYAVYDKIPSDVSKDRLINQTNDKKSTSMEVGLTFTTDGHVYNVQRRRGAQGGMQLFEDGNDITPASSGAFNQKVEDLVGMTYNMFCQVILFNGNAKPFLDFSVGDQRILTEELFKVTTLSRKANACKKRVAQTDKDIALQKQLIEQQKKQNQAYAKHLIEAKDRVVKWEEKRAADIAKLRAEIQEISQIDFDSEEALLVELESLRAQLSPIQFEIKELNTRLSGKINEKFAKKTELVLLESSKKQSDLSKLESELSHLADAKCPYCLQKYEDSKIKIEELTAKVGTLTTEIELQKERIALLKTEEAEFLNSSSKIVEEISGEIIKLQDNSAGISAGIAEINGVTKFSSIKDLSAARSGVVSKEATIVSRESESNPHTDAVVSLEAEGPVVIDEARLEELITLQEHQKFLVKLLMDKHSFIRKNIISKTIPFLNKRIGYYTEKLNLPHLVMFQPDMSCEITQYGRPLDHGNLSNGEKKRLNLALCFSFRDVSTYLHAKVNLLFTDEIDGGSLDSTCVDMLISLLKKKAWDDNLGIFVISHRPEFDGRCDRTLVVRKERGFSSLIDQPND